MMKLSFVLLAVLLAAVLAVPVQEKEQPKAQPTEATQSTTQDYAQLPLSPLPPFEREPTSDEDVVAHPCYTHGVMNDAGLCDCEEGFSGKNCELVVVTGQLRDTNGRGFANCTVRIFDSYDIKENDMSKHLADGKCDENGIYQVPVPLRRVYAVLLHSAQGSEARTMFSVPPTRSRRELKNRNRRSHTALWGNMLSTMPSWMTGELWWITAVWGYDHTPRTCNLNLGIWAPFNGVGCIGDSFYYSSSCYDLNNWWDHSIERMGSYDESCYTGEFAQEYLWLFEIDSGVNFTVFVYNSEWTSFTEYAQGNYQGWRDITLPYSWNPYWTWGYEGIFAHVHFYKSDENGLAELVDIVNVAESANATLYPGLYWNVATLEVNTIPENAYVEAAGNGIVHRHNTIHCSPKFIWGNDNPKPFEIEFMPHWRGFGC